MSNDMLKRVQTLQRYMYAMKDGDIETVAALLEDAEQDQALATMLLEVNAGYQNEESPPIQKDDIVQAQHLMRTIAYQDTRRESMQDLAAHAENASTQINIVRTQQLRNTDPTIASIFPVRGAAKQKWYRSRRSWIASLVAAILAFFIILQSNGALANQILSFLHYQPVPYKVINKAVNQFYTTMDDVGNFTATEKLRPPSVLTQAQIVHKLPFPLILPQHLPQQVGSTPSFILMQETQETYTFSSAKAHAYLTKIGHGNVHIPANLDGATFRFTQGMNVQALYEGPQASNNYGKATFLSVTETPRSEFQATGKATVQNFLDFMLSLPNVPPVAVAYLIQNNGSMPFPVLEGMHTQSVTVHHVPGLLVSDNAKTQTRVVNTQSQLSTMLEWQENGINYMVTGSIDGYTMNTSQLLAAANSLHS